MCRSIKTLREPYTESVTSADVHAAALQYVRKISGFQRPAAHNQEAFDHAVAHVAETTQWLLDNLTVKGGSKARTAGSRAGSSSGPSHDHDHGHHGHADHDNGGDNESDNHHRSRELSHAH